MFLGRLRYAEVILDRFPTISPSEITKIVCGFSQILDINERTDPIISLPPAMFERDRESRFCLRIPVS